MLCNLVAPLLVHKASDVPLLMIVFGALTLPPLLVALVGVHSSLPPSPPSPSAAIGAGRASDSFWRGARRAFSHVPFCVAFVAFGFGLGAFNVSAILLSHLFCAHGYTDQFAGVCTCAQVAAGLVAGFFVSAYIDRTKRYLETTKISYSYTRCLQFMLNFTNLCQVSLFSLLIIRAQFRLVISFRLFLYVLNLIG